jgi:hypothetical protein
LYLNSGHGDFSTKQGIPSLGRGYPLAIDVNNDSNMDIVFTGAGSGDASHLFLNWGTHWEERFNWGIPDYSESLSLVSADVDNDGDVDIYYSGIQWSEGLLANKTIEGRVSSANIRPTPPHDLHVAEADSIVRMSWSAGTDTETPTRALSYNVSVGSKPGSMDILSPMSNLTTGKRLVMSPGNAGTNTFKLLRGLPPGKYYWTVQTVDNELSGSLFAPVDSFTVGIVDTSTLPIPTKTTLSQNYPNPFNPTTAIGYQLSTVSYATLKVYDVLGREVATLVNEVKQPGTYTVQWNAIGMASGVYFYRLQAGSFTETRKLVVLR